MHVTELAFVGTNLDPIEQDFLKIEAGIFPFDREMQVRQAIGVLNLER